MKQSTKIWLLVGVIILASFLRLYHITSTPPGLYPDEAMDGNNALEVLQTGHFKVFYTEDNGREGLYVNLLVPLIKFLGNKPWVVRLPAAIAGIFTVLGMYFLVAELFQRDKGQETRDKDEKKSWSPASFLMAHGSQIALLSAFLLATSFWHINFSRIGFRAILAPLCLIWAFYWFLKSIKSKRTGGSVLYAIFAGAIFGAGFYTYIAYRVTPLLFLLFIPFFKRSPGFWKRAFLFVAAAFIVALPIGLYFLHNPGDFFGRTSEIAVTNSSSPLRDFAVNFAKTALMFNFRGDSNWRHNISGAPELFWPVGILFVVGVLWSIYLLCQRRKRDKGQETWDKDRASSLSHVPFAMSLIFSWLVLAALPAAASNDGIPHALRSILMLPPAIMLAAIGGVWLYGVARSMNPEQWMKKLIDAVAILFILLVALNAYFSYFIVWAQNPNVPGSFNADYVAIGDQINALPQSTPKYVVVNAGGVLARGIPVPAETVMFVTNSFTTSTQIENHITYLLPGQLNQIPAGTPSSTIFYVN